MGKVSDVNPLSLLPKPTTESLLLLLYYLHHFFIATYKHLLLTNIIFHIHFEHNKSTHTAESEALLSKFESPLYSNYRRPWRVYYLTGGGGKGDVT